MSRYLKEQSVMLGLIAFLVLIFIGQQFFAGWYAYMAVPQRIVQAWELALAGEVEMREFVPLLTAALLHGGYEHLIFNMLFLWMFGGLAVQLVGNRWMLVTFFVTALSGSVTHVIKNADDWIPMLGASGAVMGFEGLYLGMVARWHLPDPYIWPMAHPISPARLAAVGIMGLVMDYMGFLGGNLGVAYSAHLGGFVGGVLLGAFIVPMPKVAQPR